MTFDAYIIRIVDEDGDVVDEGDDVSTIREQLRNRSLPQYTFDTDGADATMLQATTGNKTVANQLFVYRLVGRRLDGDPSHGPTVGSRFDDKETDLGTAKCPDQLTVPTTLPWGCNSHRAHWVELLLLQ